MSATTRLKAPLHTRAVFTTGAIADLCCCSARTVSKWIDAGELVGVTLPLSKDRRVDRADLLAFLERFKLRSAIAKLNPPPPMGNVIRNGKAKR